MCVLPTWQKSLHAFHLLRDEDCTASIVQVQERLEMLEVVGSLHFLEGLVG